MLFSGVRFYYYYHYFFFIYFSPLLIVILSRCTLQIIFVAAVHTIIYIVVMNNIPILYARATAENETFRS